MFNTSFFIITIGMILRLIEYMGNRSIRLEEASLALNIISKSFLQLARPLHLAQYAPIGFLWLEKLSFLTLGDSEYSLRLLPFLASLISIPLFYKVSKFFLSKQVALFSLLVFSILDILIYYSSEIKQYSVDVFVTLLTYYLILKFVPKLPSVKAIVLLSLIGSLTIWFSHPNVFVLAGVGCTLMVSFILKKQLNMAVRWGVCCTFWFVSFALSYLISLRQTASDQPIKSFWQWAFAANPLSNPVWYFNSFLIAAKDILNVSYPFLVMLIFIFACVWFVKKSRIHFFLLITPLIFAILASILQFYPLIDRFTLFFIPNFIIILIYGIDKLTRKSFILSLFLIFLIFYPSLVLDWYHLKSPRVIEDVKSTVAYYAEKRQDGDIVYIYYGAESPYYYYASKYGLSDTSFILGTAARENPALYRNQIDLLRGKKRVWFLFSHVVSTKAGLLNEEQFFLNYLDNIGKRLDQFQAVGASIYLYDLSEGI